MTPAQLFTALRVAATGRTVSPPLFDTLAVLGKDRVLVRLDDAVERLVDHMLAELTAAELRDLRASLTQPDTIPA